MCEVKIKQSNTKNINVPVNYSANAIERIKAEIVKVNRKPALATVEVLEMWEE